jgi:hypothetical protein
MVDRYADRNQIAVNDGDAECFAERNFREAQAAAGGHPGYCERKHKYDYPCVCSAPH